MYRLYIYIYIYIYINYPQGMKLRRFKIVHLLTSGTFKAPEFPYVIQTRTCINYM